MSELIVHHCPDCGQPLHIEVQEWKHKPPTRTHTCRTPGCMLNSVTLSTGEWQTVDLNPYRRINAGKAVRS